MLLTIKSVSGWQENDGIRQLHFFDISTGHRDDIPRDFQVSLYNSMTTSYVTSYNHLIHCSTTKFKL